MFILSLKDFFPGHGRDEYISKVREKLDRKCSSLLLFHMQNLTTGTNHHSTQSH